MTRIEPERSRLPRAARREQILEAATTAFARTGFAGTGLDDIASEAGVTRVILYRHFDSKTELYRASLDRFCAVLRAHVSKPVGGFTDATIDGLVRAAATEPDGFRLLFVHAAREPEFAAIAERFRSSITRTARIQIAGVVADRAWADWAAELAPTVAIESIVAWLDAGQPDPDLTANRIRHLIAEVIAAAGSTVEHPDSLPPTRTP
ncbi:MAG: TetR/AcrR family transcriptional regulator [Pseudolysinimonas sp.]|uniref:TetR/AcrR family transcriptional regulator n=1 Tax=Pseudolysinimonas sp. TaxID=2680009 RepID=UPI003C71504F